MRRRAVLPILPAILSVFAAEAFPSAYAKEEYNIRGRLGIGAEETKDDSVADQFEVRLGIRTKRKDRVRGYVEVKADEDDRDVKIHDAYADYKSESGASRIRAGRGKKVIGWEYEYSTADRLTIKRSAAYQYLEDRSLVGRDYFAYYQWHLAKKESSDDQNDENGSASYGVDASKGRPLSLIDPSEVLELGIAIHYDEAKNGAVILSAIVTPSPLWRFGLWAGAQGTRDQDGRTDTFNGALSALFQSGVHRAGAELFFGRDPFRTEIEENYGGGRNVAYGAIKAEYGFLHRGWNPFYVATVLWKDLDHRGDRTETQALGLRYYIVETLNFTLEWDRNKNISNFDPTSMPYKHSEVLFMGRYFF